MNTDSTPPPDGSMPLNQLIAMLMAAQAQGATHVRLAQRGSDAYGSYATEAGIDWVSMKPVNKVVYVGSMAEWSNMDNTALESLDW